VTAFNGSLILGVAGWIVFLISLTASRYAARSKVLLDYPNIRSNHTFATSKAGGLAFMGAWLTGVFVFCLFNGLSAHSMMAAKLAGLGLLALLLGWADDRGSLRPVQKLAGQFVIAVIFTVAFSPLLSAPAPMAGEVTLGAVGPVITVFWIVAFMNIFNFMDGANGIASGCAAFGLCVFGVMAGALDAVLVAMMSILLAIAVVGFFPGNFSRGKLFMGDNGSQALSFIIAALAVLGANHTDGALSALSMPVIFAPFIFDVAWTLLHRLLRRKNIFKAHREHLYQLLIRMGNSHKKVTIFYMGLTGFSSAAAIIMLAVNPAYQWIAPALLLFVFMIAAIKVHINAWRAGLFNEEEAPQSPAPA